MNILNVTTMVGLRGGDLQMYTVYKLLRDTEGINQFILCPENADLAAMCKQDNAACITYKKNRFKVYNTINAIISICKKEKIDVLHIHDSTALTYALIALKFLPSSIKLILSRKRNNRIKDKVLNRYKYTHPKIVKIVSVSKAVEAIFDNLISDKSRLITIYDAIDVAKYASKTNQNLLRNELNLDTDTKIVGNIAGLTKQKDIFTFVDTAKRILETKPKELKIKFVVIGTGVEKEGLEAYVKELGLENDVFFLGFRSNADELLPEFDVFLMTSITEGLPLTIYEAFASRIPVVSTDAGGIKEVVENYKTGFVTPQKDTDALAYHVLEVLSKPELAEAITHSAYTLVKQQHDLPVIKRNYIAFYNQL